MSYEGREQHICANGHLFEMNCQYSYDDEHETPCPYCKAKSMWTNHIDDTNGEAYGEILQSEFDRILIKPAVYKACNMGHEHLISEATYSIPIDNQLVRSYYNLSEKQFHDVSRYYGV